MDIAITAIGTANPAYKRNQMETAELISAGLHLKSSEKRLLRTIYKATGIEFRHSVLDENCRTPDQFDFFPNDPNALYPTTSQRMKIYKDNALQLAISAIENCMLNFRHVDINQITHLITVSCTGMYAPGIDIEIVQQLKLKSSTQRTAINFMGCYGAFNALKVADAICRSDFDAKVMIVCVELCTIHFQRKMDRDNIISNAIFADGAAVAFIESHPKVEKYLSLERFYCELLPQSSQEMAWNISDSGFDIVLSSYVPELIQSAISPFIHKLLNQHQMNFKDIDFFAIHPGGIKILQACEEALGISYDTNKYAYHVLKNYGNMSSATILFVLKELFNDLSYQDNNKKIFSCAFGPGLTLESMFLKANHA